MLAELTALAPASVLVVASFIVLVFRNKLASEVSTIRVHWAFAALMAVLAFWTGVSGAGRQTLAGQILIDDAFTRISHSVILTAGAVALVFGSGKIRGRDLFNPDMPVLLALAVTGLLLASGAGDLVALFFGLELYALAFYALIAQRSAGAKATDAALRALLVGLAGSAMLLFGAALVIAASGATSYRDISLGLSEAPSFVLILGMALMISGLAWKASLAPFHLWFQSVIEAAPWPVTVFVVSGAQFALIAALARLAYLGFDGLQTAWQSVFSGLGLLCIAWGAVSALIAIRISHLIAAFTTIGAGFGLLALSADSPEGVAAMLAHMILQSLVLVGLVAFWSLFEREGRPIDDIAALNMYSAHQMTRAFALLLLLLGAAAVPPLVGYPVRLGVVLSVYESGLVWQGLAGVAGMVVAAFAFLRPVWRMYLVPENHDVETVPARVPDLILTVTAAAMVLGLFSLGGLDAVLDTAAARLAE